MSNCSTDISEITQSKAKYMKRGLCRWENRLRKIPSKGVLPAQPNSPNITKTNTMKSILPILLFLIAYSSYGQETVYKNYKVYNFIDFLDDGVDTYIWEDLDEVERRKVKFLVKEQCLLYKDLLQREKESVDKDLGLIRSGLLLQKSYGCNEAVTTVNKSNVDNKDLLQHLRIKVIRPASTFDGSKDGTTYKAGLKFEGDRLYVNLWPFKTGSSSGQNSDALDKSESLIANDPNKEKDSEVELFYEMPDDHTAKFCFTEGTFSAVTVPLKYRFSTTRTTLDTRDENNIQEIQVGTEEFSASANAALFGGISIGQTKFTHRKKIGNRTNTLKATFGGFVGFSVVELGGLNTDIVLNQPQFEREGTFGTASFGLGLVGSWNKVSLGIFYGVDKAIGNAADNWIYDGQPWLGFGIGYDIFKL